MCTSAHFTEAEIIDLIYERGQNTQKEKEELCRLR